MFLTIDVGGSFVKCGAQRYAVLADTTVAEYRAILRDLISTCATPPTGIVMSCQMHGYTLFDAETDELIGDFVSWQRGIDTADVSKLPADFTKRTGLLPRPTLPIAKIGPQPKLTRVRSLCEAILTERNNLTHATMACGMGVYDLNRRGYDPTLVPPNCVFDDVVHGIGHAVLGAFDGIPVLTAVGDMLCAWHCDPTVWRCINIGTGSQVMQTRPDPALPERRPAVSGDELHCLTQIPAGRWLNTLGIPFDELVADSTSRARAVNDQLAAQYADYVVPGKTQLRGGVAQKFPGLWKRLKGIEVRFDNDVQQGLDQICGVLAATFEVSGTMLAIAPQPQIIPAVPQPYAVKPRDAVAAARSGQYTFVVCDATVAELHGLVADADVLITPTEANKTLDHGVTTVLDALRARGITKAHTVLAIGGGIVQDIVGFACTVYKRGVPWVYAPTTLLGMCDSCIGGKVGINYGGVKNLVGLFTTPIEIWIDAQFLTTLPEREVLNGLGEMVKFAVLLGPIGLRYMRHNLRRPEALIPLGLAVKTAVVVQDQYDRRERLSLNLGHTVGHAVEAATDNAVSHGIAVAVGIEVVRRAFGGGDWGADYIVIIRTLLGMTGELPELDRERFVASILQDKKNRGTRVCFAAMRAGPGKCGVAYAEGTDALFDLLITTYDAVRRGE